MRTSNVGGALRRRWAILPTSALIFLLAAVTVARTIPPTFEAEALLRIDLKAGNAFGQPADSLVGQYLATMLTSSRTLAAAAGSDGLRDLGYTPSQLAGVVTALPIRGSDTVAVRARSSSSVVAARIADSVAQEGIAQNRREAEASLASSRLQIEVDFATATDRLIQLRTQFGARALGGEMARLQVQYVAALAREQRLDQEVATRSDSVVLLQASTPPDHPISPDLRAYLLSAFVLAIAIGLLVVLMSHLVLAPAISAEDFGRAIGADVVMQWHGETGSLAPFSMARKVLRVRFPGAERVFLSSQMRGPHAIETSAIGAQELFSVITNRTLSPLSQSMVSQDALLIVSTVSARSLAAAVDVAVVARRAGIDQIAALLMESDQATHFTD